MASSSLVVFNLLVISSLFFAIGANARPGIHFHPCKTLFISSLTISSSSSSFDVQTRNPNPNPNENSNPPRFFTIFDFYPTQPPLEIFVNRQPHFDAEYFLSRALPLGLEKHETIRPIRPSYHASSSSLRDRTKDILSVVVALLFGVGCGALTSATMYLVWSVINNRHHYDEDDFSDDDDIVSAKKMGYSKIPDATTPSPVPAAPAKEEAV